jgi:hypothetical protein
MDFEERNSKLFSHDFRKYSKKPKTKKPAPQLPENLKNLCKILMKENYLTDLEQLMTSLFLIAVKPKSELNLLVSLKGKEYLISSSGRFLAMLNSGLPKDANEEPNTIIECYFVNNQLILHDLILWDLQDFRSKPVEKRIEFLSYQTKSLSSRSVQVIMQEYLYCHVENLQYCYSSSKNYMKDGIFFYRKGERYQHGFSPHKLLWKDKFCADIENISNNFLVSPTGSLVTGDNFKVFKLDNDAQISSLSLKIVKTQALEIENFLIIRLSDLEITQQEPSPWSSVVFNWKLLNNQIRFEDFLDVLNKNDQMDLEAPAFFDFETGFEYNDFESALQRKVENESLAKFDDVQESSEFYTNGTVEITERFLENFEDFS